MKMTDHPQATDSEIMRPSLASMAIWVTALALSVWGCTQFIARDTAAAPGDYPPAEEIHVSWLPLPPTAPVTEDGSIIKEGCLYLTGCMSPADTGIEEGPSYMKDGEHVLLPINFAGAPQGSAFSGPQVIAVKTRKNAVFSNGDAWKCLTCEIPALNQAHRNVPLDHPQSFHDGKRVLVGTNILECGAHAVTDDACTPEKMRIYPIWWQVTADGSGPTGSMRELRLSNDDVTLGWSHISFNSTGISQDSYVGRLRFNESPATGEPRAPRYELEKVFLLHGTRPEDDAFYPHPTKPDELVFNPVSRHMGELRGFTSDGKQVIGINAPAESSHVDLFTTDLATGETRRLTQTEYTDPIKMSPDDQWFVDLDVQVSGRSMFLGGMDGLPPFTDMVTIALVSEARNNRNRRFFQPMLVDKWGQRGSYVGQQINAGDDAPGSGGISDPNWNARADPTWSPDGTKVVYWQALLTAPSCGGAGQQACPVSTEPGGRRTRLMIADLVSRKPLADKPTASVTSVGAWATPYVPGSTNPQRYGVPSGTYTLRGKLGGIARATFVENEAGTSLVSVSVTYVDFANDCRVFNGSESAVRKSVKAFLPVVEWTSDIVMSGCESGTKISTTATGEKGPMIMSASGNDFQATGALTTTINGNVYRQPANGN